MSRDAKGKNARGRGGSSAAPARRVRAPLPAFVLLGADHAGVAAKEVVKRVLEALGVPYEDVGSFDAASDDDYPVIARRVAKGVALTGAKGILICGSGTGMAIAANKVPGVRAAFAFDEYGARMARRDNDANVLTLRGRRFPRRKLGPIVRAWLTTPFSGLARHRRRLAELRALEEEAWRARRPIGGSSEGSRERRGPEGGS